MEKEKNIFYSILQRNSDNIFSPNGSILIAIIIIKNKIEQRLKRICQKNKIAKNFLKKNNRKDIPEIKRWLYISKIL